MFQLQKSILYIFIERAVVYTIRVESWHPCQPLPNILVTIAALSLLSEI